MTAATAVIKTKRKPTGAAAMGPGPGRPPGMANKITSDVRSMVLAALNQAGGVAYLTERAMDPRTASAFLSLLGKVLPLQITGEGGGAVAIRVEFVQAEKPIVVIDT